MFGNYCVVLLGKISLIQHCHDMRRDFVSLSFSCLYMLLAYRLYLKGSRLKITVYKVGKTSSEVMLPSYSALCTCSPLGLRITLNNCFLFGLRAI